MFKFKRKTKLSCHSDSRQQCTGICIEPDSLGEIQPRHNIVEFDGTVQVENKKLETFLKIYIEHRISLR